MKRHSHASVFSVAGFVARHKPCDWRAGRVVSVPRITRTPLRDFPAGDAGLLLPPTVSRWAAALWLLAEPAPDACNGDRKHRLGPTPRPIRG
jgi:hypothetical protein